MRKLICTLIAIAGICTAGVAQERQHNWSIDASGGIATFTDGAAAWTAGLTAGYYFFRNTDIRMDLNGTYFFKIDQKDYISTSLLVTIEEPMTWFNSSRWINTSSIGVGVLFPTAESKGGDDEQFADLLIHISTGVGYLVTDWMSVGTKLSMNFNINNFMNRSPYSIGLILGFRF